MNHALCATHWLGKTANHVTNASKGVYMNGRYRTRTYDLTGVIHDQTLFSRPITRIIHFLVQVLVSFFGFWPCCHASQSGDSTCFRQATDDSRFILLLVLKTESWLQSNSGQDIAPSVAYQPHVVCQQSMSVTLGSRILFIGFYSTAVCLARANTHIG